MASLKNHFFSMDKKYGTRQDAFRVFVFLNAFNDSKISNIFWMFYMEFRKAVVFLVHTFVPIFSNKFPVQVIFSFFPAGNCSSVMPSEAAQLIVGVWRINCNSFVQDGAGNAVGIDMMILCKAICIPKGFG